MIRIEVDERSGFCTGVIKAVKAAEEQLETSAELCSLRELVHNPEEVKRATTMMHKTQQLMLEYGGALFRNMFGAGEYHLPLWGIVSEYLNILKDTRKAFDPANLMHPDVLPATDDYI